MTFVLTIICLLLFYNYRKQPFKKASTIFIVLISLILILLSGLRHETIGNDTINYLNMFESIKFESWKDLTFNFFSRYLDQSTNQDKDPGYAVFVKTSQLFISDSRAYLFLIAILFFTSLGMFIKAHTTSMREVFFFYVFYINLFNGYVPNSAIRQTIAISIVLFAYTYLQKHKWKQFLLLVLFASFFHKSVLICLLVFPFIFIKCVDKIYYIGLPLFLALLTSVNKFALLFLTGNDVYNGYLSRDYYGDTGKPFVILILMVGFYLIGFWGIRKDNNLINNRLFYIGTVLSLMFSTLIWINPSLIRIMTYFAPLMGITVGSSFNRIPKDKIIFTTVILIFLLSATRSLDSYHFMWETVEEYL